MFKLPKKSQIASFDVDAQCGFTPLCPDELPVPGGHTIASALNVQATFAQFRVGSKDAHPPNAKWVATRNEPTLSKIDGENMDVRWPKHCVPGTKGFELIPGLPHPSQYDFFVYKGIEVDMHPYGSCFHNLQESMSTGIIEFLRYHNVTTILVGGLTTEFCVKLTALQLLRAHFEVIVNLSACKGLYKNESEEALEILKQNGAIIIHKLSELVPQKDN